MAILMMVNHQTSRSILDSGFATLLYGAIIGKGPFKLCKWSRANVQTTCVCSRFTTGWFLYA